MGTRFDSGNEVTEVGFYNPPATPLGGEFPETTLRQQRHRDSAAQASRLRRIP